MSERSSQEGFRAAASKTLYAALRPAGGVLVARWSESSALPGACSLNELLSQVTAWRTLDVSIAEELLRAAYGAIDADGFAPAWIRPDGARSADCFAWPTLALCTQLVWRPDAGDRFVADALPRLAVYLQGALNRFYRPEGCCWVSDAEAFIPEIFDEGLCAVDLTALLLCETDAYLHLIDQAEFASRWDSQIRAARASLATQVAERLWDRSSRCFHDRYAGGDYIQRTTLAGYLPLLWRDLDHAQRATCIHRLQTELDAGEERALALWERWGVHEPAPPLSALHLTFLLHAVRVTGDTRAVQSLETAIRTQISDRFARLGVVPADLRAEAEHTGLSVTGAALAVVLTAQSVADDTGSSPTGLMERLDRHRKVVVGAVVGLAAVAVLSVALLVHFKRTPTGAELVTMTSLAERHYADGRHEEAAKIYESLLNAMDGSPFFQFRLGNALFKSGRLEDAAHHYRLALNSDNPSPSTLYNLAVTLHRLGRHGEAADYFQKIIDMQGERPTAIAARARTALEVMEPHVGGDQ